MAGASALLLAAGASTAQAEPRPSQTRPGNWMRLVVLQENGDVQDKLLRCTPRVLRLHPACEVLKEVKGDIKKVEPLNIVCSMIYQPVTAVAYGMWDGERRAYTKNFPNSCTMNGRTHGIFAAVEGVK